MSLGVVAFAQWSIKKDEVKTVDVKLELNEETAFNFSKLALKCIHKEYPNHPSHVLNSEQENWTPKEMHPAFYGCFDWHSSVHGHWMLVKLLKKFPNIRNNEEIRKALAADLTKENILQETAYMNQPNRKSFERTYGWAWFLKLVEELHTWDDPDGKTWRENMKPLEEEIVNKYTDFLPKQTYPIRTGVHPNTAFGIAFALDYAKTVNNEKFANLLIATSIRYYQNDKYYSPEWEPGGEDFFSPGLLEADLMRRVLNSDQYWKWFTTFLHKKPDKLLTPAIVGDRSDPKIVHLDGLNLSRAWCFYGIVRHLILTGEGRKIFVGAADLHLKDALANITSGNYEGEHWLASFAVYALSERDAYLELMKKAEEAKPDSR
ncbi:MAG: DUF2891 domain-containing protein [Acidobacteria bacterium]|nr:DUF2891 domain-containing protein [Acidobacteriota bacterium]